MMLIGKSQEFNKRQSQIDFIALHYIELLKQTSVTYKFMDASYINLIQEHFVYMYDKNFETQNENTYKMLMNTINNLTEKQLANEKILNLKEDIERLVKETPPVYMDKKQLEDKIVKNDIDPQKKWLAIKIDEDMIGKKFEAKDKEYCTLYMPKTSHYKGNYMIIPRKLIVEKDNDLYCLIKNNSNILINKYDSRKHGFVNVSLSSSQVFSQFDNYRRYLKNNPDESFQRALEEYQKTKRLDMEKIEDSYKFDGYQLTIINMALYKQLPMDEFLNPDLPHLKMNELYDKKLEKQRMDRMGTLIKKYEIPHYEREGDHFMFQKGERFYTINLDEYNYEDLYLNCEKEEMIYG